MAPDESGAIKKPYPEPSGTEYGNPAGVKTGGVYRIWGTGSAHRAGIHQGQGVARSSRRRSIVEDAPYVPVL